MRHIKMFAAIDEMQDMGAIDGFDTMDLHQKTVALLMFGVLHYNLHAQVGLDVKKNGDCVISVVSTDSRDLIDAVMEMVAQMEFKDKVSATRKKITVVK